MPENIAFTWKVAGGDADAAFRDAEVTVKERDGAPAAAADRDGAPRRGGELQPGHRAAHPLGHQPEPAHPPVPLLGDAQDSRAQLRVIAPEVGGGFGSKIPAYADEALVGFAAMDLGRPVKWTEDRSENYKATIHGRDHVEYVELCGTKDGTITGLRTKVYAGLGAYASTAAPGVPTILHGLIYPGPYTIPNMHGTIYGVYTNTTPVDAYRGAGRPEATHLLERLVDIYARKIKMDPVEVRRKNLIPADQFPYTTATGLSLRLRQLRRARSTRRCSDAGLPRLPRGAGQGSEAGPLPRHRGRAPTSRSAGSARRRWRARSASAAGSTTAPSCGSIRPAWCGSTSAASRTARAKRRPSRRSWPTSSAVRSRTSRSSTGDTETTPQGWGTYGSRTTAVCGSAVMLAAQQGEGEGQEDRRAPARGRTSRTSSGRTASSGAGLARPGEELRRGGAHGERRLEHAGRAWSRGSRPRPSSIPPISSSRSAPTSATVEVDTETGEVKILRYVAVDDCGPHINPMIVEGQVHGGVDPGHRRGAAGDRASTTTTGQLLTGTMMDYAVPKASQMPRIETDHTVTPSPVNPLGVKGMRRDGHDRVGRAW